VTVFEVLAILDDAARSQREKLAALRVHADAIRALHDDDHERVLRELRRRLKSPKLAADVAALAAELADRMPHPRPPDVPPSEPEPDEADAARAALEAAIIADPAAPDAYIVYGDLLTARGDPRGALIAIGQALLADPRSAPLRAAHRDHLAAHRERLLGPLGDHEAVLSDVDWFMGFIRACRIAPRGGGTAWLDPGLVVRWLLDRPGTGRFLQELTVGSGAMHDGYERACAALARRPRPTLRELSIGDYASENSRPPPADLSATWPMLPALRRLRVRHAELSVAPLRLPALERLSIRLDPAGLRALAATADLPALARLKITCAYPMDLPGDTELLACFSGHGMPRLRSLAFMHHPHGDRLCALLPRTPLLAQLAELDLSSSGLTTAGAASIHEHAAAYRHLRLVVDGNHLGAAAHRLLESSVAKLVWGTQEAPWDDGDGT
jgi:uncharacterized protein (TIGR02996 family)